MKINLGFPIDRILIGLPQFAKLASFVIVGLTGFTFTISTAFADTCSKSDRLAGDQQLRAIAINDSVKNRLQDYHLPFGVPRSLTALNENEMLLFHSSFINRYDGGLRTSLWAGYRLSRDDLNTAKGITRVNCFREDPRITHFHGARPVDYREPEFDQGHMVPDADVKGDYLAQINSYVMSNMSPQACRFNRGIWLTLENLTLSWADHYRKVWIISGAIFDHALPVGRDPDREAYRMLSNNGQQRVAVPSAYYKVIMREDDGVIRTIAFLLPHRNQTHKGDWSEVSRYLAAQIVSIDRIEADHSRR